jgi:hypothetical protein
LSGVEDGAGALCDVEGSCTSSGVLVVSLSCVCDRQMSGERRTIRANMADRITRKALLQI